MVPDFEIKFALNAISSVSDVVTEPQAPLVSFFLSPITNIKPVKNLTLEEIYMKIIGGDYINVTKQSHSASKPELDKLKK